SPRHRTLASPGSLFSHLSAPRAISTLSLHDALPISVALCALFGVARAIGLPFILQIALFMYAWLALFSVIGGLLHERRDELGLDDAYEFETFEGDDGVGLERIRVRNIDRIYAEWRGGSHTNA